jgi:dihydrofolate reductase
MLKLSTEAMQKSDALLLGRVTYEIFASYWPTSNDEPFASHMRNVSKYVASRTLSEAPWGPDDSATVLGNDLAGEIKKLKMGEGKDIGVIGSAGLVQSLTSEGLVDEFNLFIYPLILGSGKRLFENTKMAQLALVSTTSLSNGVVLLTYRPDARYPNHGSVTNGSISRDLTAGLD